MDMGIIFPAILGYTSNGKPYYYLKDKNICMSYSLSSESIENLRAGNYSRNTIKLPYHYPPRKLPVSFHVKSCADSPLVKKIEEAYQGISISPDWIENFNPKNGNADSCSYFHARGWVKQIQQGEISVSIGYSGRVFHPLICLQRDLRRYVSKDGEHLVGVDGKAFHPHLVATFLPKSKRQDYIDFLTKIDIYSLFVPEYYEEYSDARNEVKKYYQIFLGDENPKGPALEIYSWYAMYYPEVIEKKNEIQQDGRTVQMHLQKIEAEIFVNRVFSKADFWCLPMHDGIAVKPEDTDRAVKFCAENIRDYLGFDIKVESKKL